MSLFLDELRERVAAFDADLLDLDGAEDADRSAIVSRLFRGAHSMKGAAASVGADEIESLCHELEDGLSDVRDGTSVLDDERLQLLFTASDALRTAAAALGAGASGAPSASAAPPPQAPLAAPGALPHPASPPPAEGLDGGAARTTTVRVSVARLDRLFELSSELLAAHRAGAFGVAELRALGQHAARLDAEVRAVHMRPFGSACAFLERVASDTARDAGKSVALRIRGAEIEIGRGVIEGLRASLVHLVRNAVDHGIELPERRRERGKPPQGTIEIAASVDGSTIAVDVSDDGGGLDLTALRERARTHGVELDDREVARAVFVPGISTAATVTARSGRGVGLDIVRTAVGALGGSVDVATTPLGGTRFSIRLPLTFTTLRVVRFMLAGRTFAVDEALVERVLRVERDLLASVEGRTVIADREPPLPLASLHDLLGIEGDTASTSHMLFAIVVAGPESPIALAVDELLDVREVVIRSLGPRLSDTPTVAGVALSGDGTMLPILRSTFVVEAAVAAIRARRSEPPAAAPADPSPKRVLLVDDSLTTRTLERSILEAAGFDVITAGDGLEAWQLLESNAVDAIVSDVDMPRMDGFELTTSVRASDRLRHLPVLLVTARESEADRRRGAYVGADAYIVKSSFDQHELLDALGQLA